MSNGNHEHLDNNVGADEALSKIKTAGSITMSPELFEKIYLSPQNQVKGELRRTFANPTPVALGGFLLALTPLTCDLMNFRGAQKGDGSASIGPYFAYGGICMLLGGVGEFIVGNTFPMVVFLLFGAFWIAFGITLVPFYHAYGNYIALDMSAEPTGLDSPQFNNAFGFFLLWMGVLCFVFLFLALRTNIVFVLIFFTLVPAFGLLTAGFWYAGEAFGTTVTATEAATLGSRSLTMIKAGAAFAFVTCMLGWYIFTAIMFAALDFPVQLPVGDLSTVIKGASEKV